MVIDGISVESVRNKSVVVKKTYLFLYPPAVPNLNLK